MCCRHNQQIIGYVRKHREKIQSFVTMLLMMAGLAACRKDTTKVQINYGNSNTYSKDDMDAANSLIEKGFSGWDGSVSSQHQIPF